MAFEYMQRYLLATGRQTILYKTDTLAYKAVNNLTENDVLFYLVLLAQILLL